MTSDVDAPLNPNQKKKKNTQLIFTKYVPEYNALSRQELKVVGLFTLQNNSVFF